MSALKLWAQQCCFQRGEVVFRKGAPGDSFYVILHGQVRVVLDSGAGDELVLAVLTAGDTFGEESLLDGRPRPATAIATETTETLALSRESFVGLLMDKRELAPQLLRVLSERLREAYTFIEDAVFLDVAARLAKKLLELAQGYGRCTPAGTVLDLPLRQQDLARMLGVTRETVNKHLGAFRARGLIDLKGKRVVLRRPDELRRRVY